jgi:hypothetical protein
MNLKMTEMCVLDKRGGGREMIQNGSKFSIHPKVNNAEG